LGYPSYQDEVQVVKNTTSANKIALDKIIDAETLSYFQQLIRKVIVAENVVEYAVKLVHKTRPHTDNASKEANQYLEWGAGPRASQYLIIGAKCNAVLYGKYSPDIEDVKAVAKPILRHRIVRNFRAEAERMSIDNLIETFL